MNVTGRARRELADVDQTRAEADPLLDAPGASCQHSDAEVFAVSEVLVSAQASWLAATGRLVGETAAALLADVLQRQRANGTRLVRLDLAQCVMLDHAGFDALVDAHHAFLVSDATLILTGVGPRIARLLELTGLDQTLLTMPSAADPLPSEDRMRSGPRSEGARDGVAPAGQSAHQARAAAAVLEAEVGEQALIDRAVGVVMGRTRCSVAQATEELTVLSLATNRSPQEVAQSVLVNWARARPRTS